MVRVSSCSEAEQEFVRGARVFRALSDERWAELLRACEHRVYDAGEQIPQYRGGDDTILVVAAGRVDAVLVSWGDQCLLLQKIPAGDVVFWSPDPPNAAGAMLCTATDNGTVAYTFPTDAVVAACLPNSRAAAELLALLRHESTIYLTHLGMQAFCSVRERLVRFLLAAAPRSGARLHFSREELARLIGTGREPATRSLGRLRDEGLVRYAPREREVMVLDLARLRRRMSS